jgi:hypothetical protein
VEQVPEPLHLHVAVHAVTDVETPVQEELRAERRGATHREVGTAREVLRIPPAQVRPHEREAHRVRCSQTNPDFPISTTTRIIDRSIGGGRCGFTDEVEHKAAVGEAVGGAVEEGLAVGRPERGLGVVAVEEGVVARVRQRVPEAEHARVARRRRLRPNQQYYHHHRRREKKPSSSTP